MTTTAKDLIQRAVARSNKNDFGRSITAKELIPVLSDYLRQLYVDVAAADPQFFAASSPVAGSAGAWTTPTDAIVVFRILDAEGDEVAIVPFKDPDSELQPRLYELGRSFYSVTGDTDPAAGATLTFHYAMVHPALNAAAAWDHADNTLHASWTERHNALLIAELARYMAVKGGRAEEAELFAEEVKRGRDLLMAEVGIDPVAERARWDS